MPSSEAGLTQRFALLIGANTGNALDPPLRYAESDAHNVAALLTSAADVPQENVLMLREPSAETVRATFGSLRERIGVERARGNGVLLFVYYSGHADALAMHLGGTNLPWNELLQLTHQTNANTRLVVVDACRSGELTRVKGAHRVAPFLVPTRDDALPQGLAILASSSANESAQESDALHGSLFTHHFIEALRGAADRNADGRVTLSEAFQYSSDSTALTSAQTEEGLQHATFRYRLQGRADLVLTHPVAMNEVAFLRVREAGEYRFTVGDSSGPLALDAMVDDNGRSITLPAGRYFVQVRTPSTLRQGFVTAVSAHTVILDTASLPPVELTRVALKGGSDDPDAMKLWALNVGGGLGAPILSGFSAPWALSALATRQVGPVLLDLQLLVNHSNGQNSGLDTSMTDLSAAAGVRWFTVAGPVTLSLGPRAGLAWIGQSYSGTNAPGDRSRVAPQLQAVGRADVDLGGNFSLGLEGGVRALALTRTITTTGDNLSWLEVQPYVTFGLGYHW